MNYLGRAICFELRHAGVPVAYVAERLGISRARVSQITKEVQQELDEVDALNRTDAGAFDDDMGDLDVDFDENL